MALSARNKSLKLFKLLGWPVAAASRPSRGAWPSAWYARVPSLSTLDKTVLSVLGCLVSPDKIVRTVLVVWLSRGCGVSTVEGSLAIRVAREGTATPLHAPLSSEYGTYQTVRTVLSVLDCLICADKTVRTVSVVEWVLEECGVSTVEGSMAIRVAREGTVIRMHRANKAYTIQSRPQIRQSRHM